ncbi:MAG: PDZ domain-containing protein [Deltaproteobacteria bacterium]|uniref:PDZ domain-containing protein n=1 Tax=Hydrosulfovibrio ferrireducens TaxID=2934181 RepID=UPI0012064325|nr:MAG: PDZ domain-containing protein [Deltaproteobacteria bacterium]
MHRAYFSLLLTISLVAALTAPALAQSNTEDAHTYMVRGMAAVEMAKSNDELAAAVKEFKKATEIAPTLAPAWYNLGLAQSKIGQLKDAIASYRKYLAMAPKATDSQKVKDEIIKLEYRLEQIEQINAFSGEWVSADGISASIVADGNKLTITMNTTVTFAGGTEAWIYDDPIPSPNVYDSKSLTFHLESRGSKLLGTLESPEIPPFTTGACSLPPEKNQAEGTWENGRIVLKSNVMKFKVIMNSNDSLFAGPKVRCDGIAAIGTMPFALALFGPLGTGGIGAVVSSGASGGLMVTEVIAGASAEQAGLRKGDEIIAVDGTELSLLKGDGEKLMKLRGQPGSMVQLVVNRGQEKTDSSPATERGNTLTLSVARVDISARK